MPTHTPSPHRFLASHAPPSQKTKPKPPSTLRNALQTPKAPPVVARKDFEEDFAKVTPAKRFVIPPRHAKSNSTSAIELSVVTQPTPRPKVRRKLERIESIEGSSQSSVTATQGEHHGSPILPSIEHVEPMFPLDEGSDVETQDDEDMLFETTPHKKRRLSSLPPQTPVPAHNATSHRFRNPATKTPAPFAPIAPDLPSSTTQTPATRPQFILPALPTSPSKISKPVPEIFSPSRKHGQHVPDGLASTMTSWMIEMANTAPDRGGAIQYGSNREDGVKVRLKVRTVSSGKHFAVSEVECFPGGCVFVGGDTEPGLYNASRSPGESGQMKVLLAGTGKTRTRECVRIGVGSVVGIRAPMWDISIQEEMWLVALDWTVL